MLAKSQCWPNVGTPLFFNHTLPQPLPRVAFHRRVLQRLYNVGTTLARPFQIWRHENLKKKKFFGDTEIWWHGNFNICTTIPDLGTTHPLPGIGCEKNLETLELVVLVMINLYVKFIVHCSYVEQVIVLKVADRRTDGRTDGRAWWLQ